MFNSNRQQFLRFSQIRLFHFFSLCVQDFSFMLQAKILENSLNCRKNFSLQLNRVRLLICVSAYEETKTHDNGVVPIS